jgi:hypothetical protein
MHNFKRHIDDNDYVPGEGIYDQPPEPRGPNPLFRLAGKALTAFAAATHPAKFRRIIGFLFGL